MSKKIKYLVAPNPLDKNLTKEINGFDESFKKTKTKVIIERDLTIYLNNQETSVYELIESCIANYGLGDFEEEVIYLQHFLLPNQYL